MISIFNLFEDSKNRKYWEKIYQTDSKIGWMTKSEFKLLDIYKNKDLTNFLDIGCAGGNALIYMSDFVKGKLVGVDISNIALKVANEKISKLYKHNRDRYDFIKFEFGTSKKLKYPNNYFDLIHARNVLHTVDSYEKTFDELYRLLSNIGTILIQTRFMKSKDEKDNFDKIISSKFKDVKIENIIVTLQDDKSPTGFSPFDAFVYTIRK